ncbi:MAG: hypothetical protein QM789_04425, partial [Paenirhodobacter sp.]
QAVFVAPVPGARVGRLVSSAKIIAATGQFVETLRLDAARMLLSRGLPLKRVAAHVGSAPDRKAPTPVPATLRHLARNVPRNARRPIAPFTMRHKTHPPRSAQAAAERRGNPGKADQAAT